MEEEHYVRGTVVSTDPIVTYSMRVAGLPLGIAAARPDRFRNRKALHLIGLPDTIEHEDVCEAIAKDVATASAQLPGNRFVVLTNNEFEAYLLSTRRVPSLMSSQRIFVNEMAFRPLECAPRFDAIYQGALIPAGRPELACGVKNLGLLYEMDERDDPSPYDRARALLPHGVFINHEIGGGAYRQLDVEERVVQINGARVGLCLSTVGGPTPAALEYLLCGLPVISTNDFGGHDRYLTPPFCRTVAADPNEVAAAVADLAHTDIPKAAVRDFIMHLLVFDRHNFLITVNRLVKGIFGIEGRFPTFAPFGSGLTDRRPLDAALASLRA